MKLVNSLSLRVFCTPEEDYHQIKEGFLWILGMNEEEMKEEKIKYSETNAKGFSERKIIIIEASLEKERHTNNFIKRLNSLMNNDDKEAIVLQTNRLDEELNFYVRFDKNSVFEKRLFVTDSGECYHLRFNVAAFPRRTDVAYRVVKQIFS